MPIQNLYAARQSIGRIQFAIMIEIRKHREGGLHARQIGWYACADRGKRAVAIGQRGVDVAGVSCQYIVAAVLIDVKDGHDVICWQSHTGAGNQLRAGKGAVAVSKENVGVVNINGWRANGQDVQLAVAIGIQHLIDGLAF